MRAFSWLLALSWLFFASCDFNPGDPSRGIEEPDAIFSFDLDQSAASWAAIFAAYPRDHEHQYDLKFDYRPLPLPLDSSKKALFISGQNDSDGLQMFFKRQVSELSPGALYRVQFYLETATNAPNNCAGVGGAPGESVDIYAGASPSEPVRVLRGDGWYEIPMVRNATVRLGDISNGMECEEAQPLGYPYRMKEFVSDTQYVEVTASPDGTAWLLVGSSSGSRAGRGCTIRISQRLSLDSDRECA